MKNNLDETFKEGVLLDRFLISAEKDFVSSPKVDKEGIKFCELFVCLKDLLKVKLKKENGDETAPNVHFFKRAEAEVLRIIYQNFHESRNLVKREKAFHYKRQVKHSSWFKKDTF